MGLDIMLRRMRKVEWTEGIPTAEQIKEKYPDCTLSEMSEEKADSRRGFPKEFLFTARCHFLDYSKVVAGESTPEHPRSWNDGGWCWGGESTSIWQKEFKHREKDGCHWYLTLCRYGEERDEGGERKLIDRIVVPLDAESVKSYTTVKDANCCLVDSTEYGYMDRGLTGKFWEDMKSGDFTPFVYTKEDMEYALDNWISDDYKGTFKKEFVDRFVDGEGWFVHFWY